MIFLKKITDLTTGLRIFKRKVSEIKVGTRGKVYGLDYEAGLSGEVINRKMKYIEMAIESRPRAGQSKLAFFFSNSLKALNAIRVFYRDFADFIQRILPHHCAPIRTGRRI